MNDGRFGAYIRGSLSLSLPFPPLPSLSGVEAEMAAPLGLSGLSSDRFALPCFASLSQARSLVLDALVEIKPGEIGIVSGVPQEHLNISDAG